MPARRSRGLRFAWGLMAVLASLISGYAAAVLVVPGFGAPFVAVLRETAPWALAAHIGGGVIALAVGPWQFLSRFRSRLPQVHRWVGRTYVAAILAGGIGGLALAPTSQEGIVTHVGFGLLAVCWLACTAQGLRWIRRGNQVVHRAWMIRSFSLTLAAVTLRIILPFEMVAGIPYHYAYQAVSWLCWVPNLVAAEWVIRRGLASTTRADAAAIGYRVEPTSKVFPA